MLSDRASATRVIPVRSAMRSAIVVGAEIATRTGMRTVAAFLHHLPIPTPVPDAWGSDEPCAGRLRGQAVCPRLYQAALATIVKQEPRPWAERTSTRCPSKSAACLTMKSPSPSPSVRLSSAR